MLSLVLLAAFGFALTVQSPLLLKSSSKISGLNDNAFMNSSQLASVLESHYKQNPRDIPKTVYVFNVSVEVNTSSNSLTEAIRGMTSTKQIFAGNNGYMSNYFQYYRSAEVVETVLRSLGSLAGQYDRNMSTLSTFEKTIIKRAKSSSFGADIVNVTLSDIKSLDRFLSRAERTLADKADGKYLIAVVFDVVNSTRSNRVYMTEEVANRRILQDNGAAAADANANGDAAAPLAISSNTFTGIIVALFIVAVTLVAMNLLSDIKTPGSFIATPLNIGKEH
eukprot:CAMPEP_0176475062 /NCGR_PEP_ID=MMETSP0127-20121128/43392_1 /TAXON_ID=938130 /ORGANISM="Platyophrya macrostoma, Strain WH" /LENGTH=278 /DNA_ID=CAMNT_0017870605 /DNA_START=55 /DNA_END=891 /DNA_ORIENTATION=-